MTTTDKQNIRTRYLELFIRDTKVIVRGRSIKLSQKETQVLRLLMNNPGQPISRKQFLMDVWNDDTCSTNIVDVFIKRLREKIERDPSEPEIIVSIHGIGYKLVERQETVYTDVKEEALKDKNKAYLTNMHVERKNTTQTMDESSNSQILRTWISDTPDMIVGLSEQFRVHDLNLTALSALGRTREEIVGKSCSEVLCCKNLNQMQLCGTSSCPLTRIYQQKKPLPNEELLIGNDLKRACEVSVSVTPVTVDDKVYAVFSARDLSTLKVASQVRSNFVSMVSHELRTPLNSVHGFIDLLLQGHMGKLTEEQHTYLGYAQEGVQQLASIVEDILFMTRSDLGQFEIKRQTVHLQSLVRQVMRGLQIQALKAEVVLFPDIPAHAPLLYVDPQRIKQVLSNLVTNAIKFTPPGGMVVVKVCPYNEHFAMIIVADTGYGIPLEDRPHIFERFYQSNHNQQSKMGGYGLGLSITKLIIEQHGGFIGFDTVIDKGTTFRFTLPFYKEDTKEGLITTERERLGPRHAENRI